VIGTPLGLFLFPTKYESFRYMTEFLECSTILSWGNRRERDHWGDLGVDGRIIIGWISRRWDVGMWTRLGVPRKERVGGSM